MHSKWKKLIEWERRKAVYSLLFLCIDDVDILFGMSCTGVTGQRSGSLDVGTAGHQVGDEGMAVKVWRAQWKEICLRMPALRVHSFSMRRQ